ncbi:Transposase, Mutator family [Paracoccus isoporae]|uniref:Transposase, Mutator family n=1 Tax=Paracoccus isoporae TaxID=591205 RepID=A0A1G6WBI4_9RHOB|nr:transposase [Paracoccus isoporae]SDD63149.1 Transposase, Mutator family [Paracoccus isoporae]
MRHVAVSKARISRAKRAFSTRRVPRKAYKTLLQGELSPAPGDLVLARIDEIGKHTKLELTDGRRAHMFPGDEIIVCFGNRYAPDQYEAQIGPDLAPCDLVAAGGIASLEISRHQRMKPPTQITPIGILGDAAGRRLNLRQFGVDAPETAPAIPAVLSLGTSMNAGKTLTATSLVRGFKRLGFRVAALKITGTGAGGDMWIVRDAGADLSLDFTDAGHASTYLVSIPEIEDATCRLMNHAAAEGCDVAVIEIADGLQQLETAQLIHSGRIMEFTIGTVFAAYDAMGAKYGFDMLGQAGHDVLGLSGRLGRSPLGVREAEAATGLRVYSPWELQEGALMMAIRDRAARAALRGGPMQPALRKIADAVVPAQVALGNLVPMGMGMAEANRLGMSGTAIAREILDLAAHHVMEEEADRICGVAYRARDRKRRDWRNGFRRQDWMTDFGVIELSVPRLKHTAYMPGFVETATVPVAAVRAVLDAGLEDLEDATGALLAALSRSRRGRGDISELVGRIATILFAVRMQGRPMPGPAERPAWPLSSPIENEGLDDDEYLDDATGAAGGLEGDYEGGGIGAAFQRIAAAE